MTPPSHANGPQMQCPPAATHAAGPLGSPCVLELPESSSPIPVPLHPNANSETTPTSVARARCFPFMSRSPGDRTASARCRARSGGGGSRTRVRKPSALRPYVRSPRFGVGRRTGTDALPSTPSRKALAVQGPGSPGRPARILTVIPEPTGRDPGDRALGLFKQPVRAQRCRWLLCRCLRDLRVTGPLGTRPRASVPPSKPGRPLQHQSH